MGYILFSPVSDRDPCSADRGCPDVYRDGALLHIVRQYRPHKACLFLTERFRNFEEKDRRYSHMLKHVMPEIEIEFANCPDTIPNAALFDRFDDTFREYLEKLHQSNMEDQLLINLSSGTPQMQASLYLLAATLPFQARPIQVLSPSRDSNAGRDSYNADLAENRLGEDGTVECRDAKGQKVDLTEDRCRTVTCINAVRAILVENITQLVGNNDYAAAQGLYNSSKELFTPRLPVLLKTASAHLSLNEQEEKWVTDHGVCWDEFYEPVLRAASEEARRCYDYLLYLGTLVDRRALNDYARALSPALTTIMRMRLARAGHDVGLFCSADAKGVVKLKNILIQQKEPGFMTYLNERYNGFFKDSPLSAVQMLHYMEYLKEKKAVDLDVRAFQKLRKAEADIRNLAAHEMKGITADQVNKATGSSAGKILLLLRQEYEKAAGTGPLKWDALDALKEKILAELKFGPGNR